MSDCNLVLKSSFASHTTGITEIRGETIQDISTSPLLNHSVFAANSDGSVHHYQKILSTEGGFTGVLESRDYSCECPSHQEKIKGKHIYYNSMSSGSMELWRMKADGSDKVQLTQDEVSNWFPHPSPDGKYLVYLAYIEDQGDQHPPMKDVMLRLYDLKSGEVQTLCKFTGGQGTINVPSWSPDSKKFAFVSYSNKE